MKLSPSPRAGTRLVTRLAPSDRLKSKYTQLLTNAVRRIFAWYAPKVTEAKMGMKSDRAHQSEIRGVLSRLTAAWREERFDELEDILHQSVVFLQPGFKGRVEGRKACVNTYREFMSSAKVVDYTESDVAVDVWGATGVATYRFDMAWEMTGKPHREVGHDIFVFVREDSRWQVVWRTVIPLESRP
jgi:hypothetical protein